MRIQPVFMISLLLFAACTTDHKRESGFFVTHIGDDTLAVESYQIDANGVQGTSIIRTPRTTARHYSMTVNDQGLPESFSIDYGPVGAASQITRNYRFADDSVEVVTTQNGTTKTSSTKAAGRPYPLLTDVFGVWDYVIRHAEGPKGTREFTALFGNRALRYTTEGTVPGRLELLNPDSVFGPLYATVDSSSILQELDMRPTADKYLVERVPNLDIDALAKDFLAREQAGKGLGVLSPRDTVRAVVGGATILVDYGRPTMRGRTIFGNIVPWNVVWRLGANAATQLVTNKRLSFGRTIVLPGTYSLFAYPSKKGWKLIINFQHGQWGTVYNDSKDLARLALKTKKLKNTVEQFTFELKGRGRNGVLSFKWENTEASIPFSVR